MGTSTHGIIVDVKEEDLIKLLSAKNMIKNGTGQCEREGFINFMNRSMFCVLKKKKYTFEYKGNQYTTLYSKEYPFLKNKVKNNYWWLSLGHNEFSIEIMTFICETFGGWIDENDCDNIGWRKAKMKHKYKKNFIKRVFENDV